MAVTEEELARQMEPDADLPSDDAPPADTPPDGAGAPGTPAEPAPAPRSQEDVEKVQAALRKQAEKHAAAVEKIMGEDFAMLAPNPTDWTPGYIFNVPQMHPTTEDVAALFELMGQDEALNIPDAPDAKACEACNASGRTKTGSRVQGQETKPCGVCAGKGWVANVTVPSPPQPTGYPQGGYPPPVQPPPAYVPQNDPWGRAYGDPAYGFPPQPPTA